MSDRPDANKPEPDKYEHDEAQRRRLHDTFAGLRREAARDEGKTERPQPSDETRFVRPQAKRT